MADQKRTSRSKRRKKPKSAITGTPTSYKHLYQDAAGQTLQGAPEVVTAAVAGKGSDSVDWKGDYGYVIRDLRILFVVSILIFAVMIAAGYLL